MSETGSHVPVCVPRHGAPRTRTRAPARAPPARPRAPACSGTTINLTINGQEVGLGGRGVGGGRGQGQGLASELQDMERRVRDIVVPVWADSLSLAQVQRMLKPAFVAHATMMMLRQAEEEPDIDARYARIEAGLFKGRLKGCRECRDAVYVLHHHVLASMMS